MSATAGFVKLYGTILTSSIWLEDDATLRVWIAMLALADENGEIGASVGGLAHVARVSREACEHALTVLLAPDADSRTPDNEGRRIEAVKGGWKVLNHRAYRDLRTTKQVNEAERKARYRDKVGQSGTVHDVPTEAEGEAEVEAKAETTNSSPTGVRAFEALADCFPNPIAAASMLRSMTEGLGTPGMQAVSVEVLTEAMGELRTSGGEVTPHRFKAFVAKVLSRQSQAAEPKASRNGKGSTIRAMKLIGLIRSRRSPMFPNNVVAEWQEGLSEAEVSVCKTVGITRILNDANEGTMVAQITRALEESA